ncbi:MAG: OmpH family outer membrane protein [Desulfobacterales bacterium]|nr:OmpH family outer membrane protein [Desulfobacterales bacterium]
MRAVMSTIAISFFAIIFCINSLYAADVAKIGVIDLQKVLETSNAGKTIQATLKKQKEKMEADLKAKGTDIEKISKRLERESMVMSKEMREEKEREQRIKINDFKTLQKKYRTDLQKLEVQLMNQLQKDVKELVDSIGKKKGYLLIVNKYTVLYSPGSIDITDDLIKRLNAKTKRKK